MLSSKQGPLLLYLLALGLTACLPAPTPPADPSMLPLPQLTEAQFQDRMLGLLLGSAIGDAMGAPTEMWDRRQMRAAYGLIDGLDPHVRATSPEGVWKINLPAGGTTDDTRWKALMVDFFTGTGNNPRGRADAYQPAAFMRHIRLAHDQRIQATVNQADPTADSLEASLEQVLWLKEWAKVAEAYEEDPGQAYTNALGRFYGGEMTCAGMLYAPMIGAIYPGEAEHAYQQMYTLSLFDIGYARDISGLTAALTAAAFLPNSNGNNLMDVLREVDPQGYFTSRLVGRSAYAWYQQARDILLTVNESATDSMRVDMPLPTERVDSATLARWSVAYAELDKHIQRMPFHPGEIWLVSLTAMLVCEFDFETSLMFVTNYGRDNDTSAAIVGAILGAMYGAEALPKDWKQSTLKASKELGIDLFRLSQRMTASVYANT